MSLRARALRIALTLVAALIFIEWGAHTTLLPGTRTFDRYRALPEQARSLADSSSPSIAFIGNSVTDRIQPDVMLNEWQALTGGSLVVDKFLVDGSNLTTWYWIYAHLFWKRNVKPDLVIVTYYEGNGLADSETIDVSTLALFFTDAEDRAILFAYDLTTLEQRADYLLSSASEGFAARDLIRDRTLNFMPGYRRFAVASNALNFEYAHRRNQAAASTVPTFNMLGRFLAAAREAQVPVCFVAFPSRPRSSGPTSYIIEPKALEMIAEAGMLHLDMRKTDELSSDMYKDNVHLNARGEPIYTRRLAQELNKVWRPR